MNMKFLADIDKKFNIMLESLILKNDTQSLRILLVDIELFYKIMDKHVLRALYISMNEYMDRDMKLALYELCGEKGIYTLYNVSINRISTGNAIEVTPLF